MCFTVTTARREQLQGVDENSKAGGDPVLHIGGAPTLGQPRLLHTRHRPSRQKGTLEEFISFIYQL